MTAKDLKNALLQEAVQGKLVPQIASEGNARDLLEEIRKEKLSHGLDFANAKSGKRKSKKETALAGSNQCDISEEEIPFDIPENWCWCRLIDICNDIADIDHKMPPVCENGIPYVSPLNFLKDGTIDYEGAKRISKDDFLQLSRKCKPERGDFIFPRYGTIGVIRKVETDIDFLVSYSCATIKSHLNAICSEYIYYVLNSPLIQQEEIQKYINKTTQPNVGLQSIKQFLFPLPPLAEQKRIVAAIEKFMPLIEEYGKKETELKALNEQIGTLTKKAILQEAVQGKLVPQIAAEGNAKDLLEEIKKARHSELVSESKSKAKKEKPLPDITEEEIPFDIPENWCWCRFDEATLYTTDYIANGSFADTRENVKFYKTKQFALLVKTQDFANNFSYDLTYTDEHGYNFLKKSQLSGGELLLSNIGASIGKAFIVPKLSIPMAVAPNSIIVKCINETVTLYIKYLMLSFFGQSLLKEFTAGTAMPKFSKTQLRNCIIPLPPLAEQKRIVAAIEKMLPLCEKLGV